MKAFSTILLITAMMLWIKPVIWAEEEPSIEGIWQGVLKVQTIELRILFKIKKSPDGTYTAFMDSPDQGATDIPMDSVTWENGILKIEKKSLAGAYEGKLVEKGTKIEGTWSQAGRSLPLNLSKTDKAPEIKRPQTPKKPYPYKEEEVSYKNAQADITLAGTLTIPQGDGPFPAVVLITGSGAQDRDETIYKHRPFLVIADYMTRRGIAVLRVDDRGVGGSTGKISEATSEDFAVDVLSGVHFLKGRKEIDAKKIGLIGHSEGGIIAPIAAVKSQDIAYIVLMAGTGLTGEEILYLQGELIARAEGLSEEEIQKSREQQERIFAVVKREKDTASIEKGLRKLYEEDIAKLSTEERKKEELTDEEWKAEVKRILTPWFRFFLTYDPKTALRKVKCPVLAINGELDLQVPPKNNLPVMEQALKDAGNADYTIMELPGLNHLFQTAQTGAISEYAKIEETIAPDVLKLIGDWIRERTQ